MKRLLILMISFVLAACAQESGPDGSQQADAPPADIATRMAGADAEAGKRLYMLCQACHSLTEGDANKVGPNLYGFMARPAGTAAGFNYSAALAGAGIAWDDANLDRWLERPSALVPGTNMVFMGIKDPQQRADLIAYLQQATR